MTTAEESVADSLGRLLLRSFRTAITEHVVGAPSSPVDSATYPVVSAIARIGPVRVAELGRQIGLERSVVARRASLLIESGLVGRTPDPADPRAALLDLTPDGRRVLAGLRERLVDGIAEQLRSWPAGDRAEFARLLARFVETDLAVPAAADHRSRGTAPR